MLRENIFRYWTIFYLLFFAKKKRNMHQCVDKISCKITSSDKFLAYRDKMPWQYVHDHIWILRIGIVGYSMFWHRKYEKNWCILVYLKVILFFTQNQQIVTINKKRRSIKSDDWPQHLSQAISLSISVLTSHSFIQSVNRSISKLASLSVSQPVCQPVS